MGKKGRIDLKSYHLGVPLSDKEKSPRRRLIFTFEDGIYYIAKNLSDKNEISKMIQAFGSWDEKTAKVRYHSDNPLSDSIQL